MPWKLPSPYCLRLLVCGGLGPARGMYTDGMPAHAIVCATHTRSHVRSYACGRAHFPCSGTPLSLEVIARSMPSHTHRRGVR